MRSLRFKVKSKDLKGVKKKIADIAQQKYKLDVGIVDNVSYPNGTSVAYVAYLNEYGHGRNPQRPFMHRTFINYYAKAMAGFKANLKGITNAPSTNVQKAFTLTGMYLKDRMKKTILTWPVDDPRRNKYPHKNGDYRPLIDTHLMLNSINFKVTKR